MYSVEYASVASREYTLAGSVYIRSDRGGVASSRCRQDLGSSRYLQVTCSSGGVLKEDEGRLYNR